VNVNEGPFRHGERIGFSYLVSQKYTGESARVRILRESKIKECDIHLANHKRLVPAHIKGKPPSYYILAGIVFAAISVPYLRSEYGKDYDYDAPVKLLDKLLHAMSQTEEEQLVVVSQVLFLNSILSSLVPQSDTLSCCDGWLSEVVMMPIFPHSFCC
jgi:hypothetical protein